MNKNILNLFYDWFNNYVTGFSSFDPLIQKNIELKINHTKRVCKNILLLAESENLRENECCLAEVIALFHDLGRFEQFSKYKTFMDSESENHAALGVNILKKFGILTHLPENEQQIIYKAIEYHNLMRIPSAEDNGKDVFYFKLIRDADKLDILKIITEQYESPACSRNPALGLYLPDTPGCSEPVIKEILHNRMAKIEDVKNQNDVNLLRLSWVFDINYPETLAQLKKKRYLEKIYSILPDTEEVQIVKEHLKTYIEKKRIKEKGIGKHD